MAIRSVVVAQGRGVGGCGAGGSAASCEVADLLLHLAQLLLDVADEVRERLGSRVDCVSGHAVPAIGTYPRSSAPGTVVGFRPAPTGPPGAKALRARLAVIARRAYGSIFHEVEVAR